MQPLTVVQAGIDALPPSPPPSPPPLADIPAAFSYHDSQRFQYQPVEHPSMSPLNQPRPDLMLQHQQQLGPSGQGLLSQNPHQQGRLPPGIQASQAVLQLPVPGGPPQHLLPQHAPNQNGPFPSVPFSGAAHMSVASCGMPQQAMQLGPPHVNMASHGMHPLGPLQLQMHSNRPLYTQHMAQPPTAQPQMGVQRGPPQQQLGPPPLQMAQGQGPPQIQMGPRPALQQPYPASHPPMQLQLPQQGRGLSMPLQHGQLWQTGPSGQAGQPRGLFGQVGQFGQPMGPVGQPGHIRQPWGLAGQPLGPPVSLPPPHYQLGGPFGQLPARPPAQAPPLIQLQASSVRHLIFACPELRHRFDEWAHVHL